MYTFLLSLNLPIKSYKEGIWQLFYGPFSSEHHGILQLEGHSEEVQYPSFRRKLGPREVPPKVISWVAGYHYLHS